MNNIFQYADLNETPFFPKIHALPVLSEDIESILDSVKTSHVFLNAGDRIANYLKLFKLQDEEHIRTDKVGFNLLFIENYEEYGVSPFVVTKGNINHIKDSLPVEMKVYFRSMGKVKSKERVMEKASLCVKNYLRLVSVLSLDDLDIVGNLNKTSITFAMKEPDNNLVSYVIDKFYRERPIITMQSLRYIYFIQKDGNLTITTQKPTGVPTNAVTVFILKDLYAASDATIPTILETIAEFLELKYIEIDLSAYKLNGHKKSNLEKDTTMNFQILPFTKEMLIDAGYEKASKFKHLNLPEFCGFRNLHDCTIPSKNEDNAIQTFILFEPDSETPFLVSSGRSFNNLRKQFSDMREIYTYKLTTDAPTTNIAIEIVNTISRLLRYAKIVNYTTLSNGDMEICLGGVKSVNTLSNFTLDNFSHPVASSDSPCFYFSANAYKMTLSSSQIPKSQRLFFKKSGNSDALFLDMIDTLAREFKLLALPTYNDILNPKDFCLETLTTEEVTTTMPKPSFETLNDPAEQLNHATTDHDLVSYLSMVLSAVDNVKLPANGKVLLCTTNDIELTAHQLNRPAVKALLARNKHIGIQFTPNSNPFDTNEYIVNLVRL